MTRSRFWRCALLVAAIALAACLFFPESTAYVVGATSLALPFVLPKLFQAAAETIGSMLRSERWAQALMRLDALVKTVLRRLRDADPISLRHRAAPGHSWRHCGST